MKFKEIMTKIRHVLNIATYADIRRIEGALITFRSHNEYVDMEMERIDKKLNKTKGDKK